MLEVRGERGAGRGQRSRRDLDSGAAIGTTGARVSHGCIRMHEYDLLHLRDVPAGSPIYIFSS